jgi:predicted nucleotide-binding protein (sugar kinase/HSP70/actin superfamily)
VEGFIEAVEQRGLDPARAALYMTGSKIACNIGMYPAAIRAMLEDRGGGFERSAVLLGDSTFLGISVRAAVNGYFAHMFGGMLRRLTCRVRPYETHPGEAEAAAEEGLRIFTEVFEGGRPKLDGVRDVVDRFAAIETGPRSRPKVAIFGDVYVRDNEVMNQDLVRVIERHGGEVITTPYSEFIKIAAEPHLQRSWREGKLLSVMVQRSLLATVKMLEREFAAEFSRVLGPFMLRRPRKSPREILAAFGLTERHDGESVDNLLKLFHIVESDPDVALFVQANPAFCCPSLVTEAMAGRIRELTGVPLVTVTYDGTVESRNEAIVPYLQLARSRGRVPVLRN